MIIYTHNTQMWLDLNEQIKKGAGGLNPTGGSSGGQRPSFPTPTKYL
jgi:hypothetical protein